LLDHHAVFEGSQRYPGAGLRQKNHVQLVDRFISPERLLQDFFRDVDAWLEVQS
jgi:hypothetical protein